MTSLMATSLISKKATKHIMETPNDNEHPTISKDDNVPDLNENSNNKDIKTTNDATKTKTTNENITKKLTFFVPITDISENAANATKSHLSHINSVPPTAILTMTTKIEHESHKCFNTTNMRTSKRDLEQQSFNNKNNINKNEAQAKEEEEALANSAMVPQKNFKSTHEFSTTGRISCSSKVTQDKLQEKSARQQLKRDTSLNTVNKLNSKTESNGQIENNVDAETSVNNFELTKKNEEKQNDDKNSVAAGDGGQLNVVCNACDVNETMKSFKEGALNCSEKFEKSSNRSSNDDKTTVTTTTTTKTLAIRPSTLNTGNAFPVATQTSPSIAKLSSSTPLHNGPLNSPKSLHHRINNRKQLHQYHQQQYQHLPGEVPRATAITSSAKLTPKTPPVTPDSPATYLDDDLDSIYSFATTTSGRSTMSCEHSYVAHNGTTFSGRKNKFVIHNSQHAGLVGSAYWTPTQRAQAQIRKLKALLHAVQQDLNQKNDEVLKLTREVAELRLFKASLNSPEERSASSDAVTVREAELQTSQDVSPIVDMADDGIKSSPRHMANSTMNNSYHHQNYLQQQHNVMQISSEMQSSFADSGHFEDMTSMSVHSKDTHDGSDEDAGTRGNNVANAVAAAEREVEVQRQELIRMYEQRIEELIRNQDVASNEMKRIHNDKVEALLQKLSECNTRYADIVPDFEMAKERIRELEEQLEDLQRKLFENEDKQNKMYLHMYQKGQEAERIARADQALELAHRAPTNHVSINELLHQLQSTQDELENIRAAEYKNESGSNHALLTAKEAISLWVLGARKTIYRRLLEAQKNRTHVDPEVTLQFLKSAVYYFLTDKENSQGHLQAIESILEFTEAEKQNIDRARAAK